MKNIFAPENVKHQFTIYEQYACNLKKQCITVPVGAKGEKVMIERIRNKETGEIEVHQFVECPFYMFWREEMLRPEDQKANVEAVLTIDFSGVRLDDDKKVVRLEPVRFILPDGNDGETVEKLLQAEIELPDNIEELVDKSQIEKIRKYIYSAYKFVVEDPEYLKERFLRTLY